MSERDRDVEWERERERAARGYAEGRVTPKNESNYARSQHGSNAPSPAFGRPAVYERDDAREHYNRNNGGGYDQGAPGRYEERGPPLDSDRDYAQQRRYEGYADDGTGRTSRPVTAPRGPTPDIDRTRPVEDSRSVGVPNPNIPASGTSAKSRRAPKSKEELDASGAPVSPVPSAASKKTKGSRASSPWAGKTPGASAKAGRAEAKGGATPSSAGKKSSSTSLKGRDEAAQQQREISPASSEGSNEPLAARGPPTRVVDEDYDEGAADALMGLAGAASASAPQPAADRGQSPEKRADSLLGKRPFADENADSAAGEESSKRSKNGVTSEPVPTEKDSSESKAAPANDSPGDNPSEAPAAGKIAEPAVGDKVPEPTAAENDATGDKASTPTQATQADEPKGTDSTKEDAEVKNTTPVVAVVASNSVEDDSKEEEEGQINEEEGDVSMKGPGDAAADTSSNVARPAEDKNTEQPAVDAP